MNKETMQLRDSENGISALTSVSRRSCGGAIITTIDTWLDATCIKLTRDETKRLILMLQATLD